MYTRDELLAEVVAGSGSLCEVSSNRDFRRFADAWVFRFAVVFPWLRLAEPACQLVTRRLVGDHSRRAWEGICGIRNMLAHEQDIDFDELWSEIPSTPECSDAQLDSLRADH